MHSLTQGLPPKLTKTAGRDTFVLPSPLPCQGPLFPLPMAPWKLPTYPAQGTGPSTPLPSLHTHGLSRHTREHQIWQVNTACVMGWAGRRSGHPCLRPACVPGPAPGGERPHLPCLGRIRPAAHRTSKGKEVLCDSWDGEWAEGRRGTGSRCASAQSVNLQARQQRPVGLDQDSAEVLLRLGVDLWWGFHGNPEAETHRLQQIRSGRGAGVDPKPPNRAFTNQGGRTPQSEIVDQGPWFLRHSLLRPRPGLGSQQRRPLTSRGPLALPVAWRHPSTRPGPILARFWHPSAFPRWLPSSHFCSLAPPVSRASSACLPCAGRCLGHRRR